LAWQQRSGLDFHQPVTMRILAQQIHMQAQMIAFNDIAWFTTMSLVFTLPFIFMLKKPKMVPIISTEGH
jgi:hypothetical protein